MLTIEATAHSKAEPERVLLDHRIRVFVDPYVALAVPARLLRDASYQLVDRESGPHLGTVVADRNGVAVWVDDRLVGDQPVPAARWRGDDLHHVGSTGLRQVPVALSVAEGLDVSR